MPRNIAFIVLALAAMVMIAPNATAQVPTFFNATLSGAQEVPANASPATGTGSFTLNAAQTQLSFNVSFSGFNLTPSTYTVAHFHNAAPGIIGPVVRGMGGPPEGPNPGVTSGAFAGIWANTDAQPLTPAMVTQLFAGNIYFNVHSSAFAGGEIRGVLTVVPEPTSMILAGVGLTGLAWRRFRKPAAQ